MSEERKMRGECPVCETFNTTFPLPLLEVKTRLVPEIFNYRRRYVEQHYLVEKCAYTCKECGAKWKEENEVKILDR